MSSQAGPSAGSGAGYPVPTTQCPSFHRDELRLYMCAAAVEAIGSQIKTSRSEEDFVTWRRHLCGGSVVSGSLHDEISSFVNRAEGVAVENVLGQIWSQTERVDLSVSIALSQKEQRLQTSSLVIFSTRNPSLRNEAWDMGVVVSSPDKPISLSPRDQLAIYLFGATIRSLGSEMKKRCNYDTMATAEELFTYEKGYLHQRFLSDLSLTLDYFCKGKDVHKKALSCLVEAEAEITVNGRTRREDDLVVSFHTRGRYRDSLRDHDLRITCKDALPGYEFTENRLVRRHQ